MIMKKKDAQEKEAQDFTHFTPTDWKLYYFKKQRKKEEREEEEAGLVMVAIYIIVFALLIVYAVLDGLVVL